VARLASRRLIGRRVKVTIKPKPESQTPDWVVIDGFDISFDIKKTAEPEPNKGRIAIYNMPERLRNKLQLEDDSTIVLEAGYKSNASVLFTGNITRAISDIQGPDIVTNIDAGEGHKAYRKSYVAKSYGEGTPLKTVIEDIVNTFDGFKVTPAITSVLANIGKTIPNALTLDGRSAKILNEVLAPLGYGYSIQNGTIQITQSLGASDEPPVNLTYATGLVGAPQLGEQKGTGGAKKSTITFQSFIQPDLRPGRRVFVDWIERKGNFVCETVTHKGSNYDNEFYSTVEAFLP
jgi:hypothetical protein